MDPVARQFVCVYQSVLGPALDPWVESSKITALLNRTKHSLVNRKLILSRAIRGRSQALARRVREKF